MGFDKLTLKINNLGDNETREKYRVALKEYFASHLKICVQIVKSLRNKST